MNLIHLLSEDYRDEMAVAYHILLKCCTRPYKEMNFEDFKWIIDRANFSYAKQYNLSLISYTFLNWNSDLPLIPAHWNADWQLIYSYTKTGKLRKTKKYDQLRTYHDFISDAGLETLNKTILRWRIYGRFFVKLKQLFTKGK